MAPEIKAILGFDRLISTLKHHGGGADPMPASPQALHARDIVLGEFFDPFLASLYARCDGGLFGDLELFGFSPSPDGDILSWNKSQRKSWQDDPRVAKCFQYGKELGDPYYFATVPSLANAEGIQPVVRIVFVSGIDIYPLASSVDKAFDLWARFCEARLRQYGRLDEWMIGVYSSSIRRETKLIAEDEELVRMLEAGSFDELVGDDPEMREWVQSVLQAARSR